MPITTGPSFLQLPHSQDADPSTLVRRADDGGIFVGPIVFMGDITLDNNRNLFIKDNTGVSRSVVTLDVNNNMRFGPPAGPIPLIFGAGAAEQMRLPTAGGLHIGKTYSVPPVGGLRTEGGIHVQAGGMNLGGNLIFGVDNFYDIGTVATSRPRDIFATRDLVVGGDLAVAGVGPHAIGGAAITDVQFGLRGPYVGTEGFRVSTDLFPPVNKPAFLHRIVGSITQFSSGTHANFDSLLINPPDIFGAGAIITNATTMRITAAPVGAINNFALWVAAGKTRLDGIVAIGGDSARAQLVVTGSVLTDNGAYGFLNSAGGTGTASGAVETSIYASQRIVGQEINANSDVRIKENVTPVQNALDIIKRLRVVGYNKLAKSGPAMGEFGLIGQELTETLPLALRVSPGDIPDGQGGWKEVDDFYQINYQTVFMLAVRAIQEQQERIEALEAAAGIN